MGSIQTVRVHSRRLSFVLVLLAAYVLLGRNTCGEAQPVQHPDVGPSTAVYLEAWQAYEKGNYERALSLVIPAMEADRRAGAVQGVAEALNLVGTIHYKEGDYSAAEASYREAEKQALQSGYQFGLARDWSSLGSTYLRTGRYGLAKEYYEKSLNLRRSLNSNGDEIARAENDLANVYQELGDLSRALVLRREALAQFRLATDQLGVADVLNDIGWTYGAMGRDRVALVYFSRSLHTGISLRSRPVILDDLESIGIANVDLGRYSAALSDFTKSFYGYKRASQKDEESQLLNDLGNMILAF